MYTETAARAAPAAILRDPMVIDRLVGTTDKSPTILLRVASTAAAHTGRRPQFIVRRVQTRRLRVGRWPRQRDSVVITIKTLVLSQVGRVMDRPLADQLSSLPGQA
jgi:hypothetical protein